MWWDTVRRLGRRVHRSRVKDFDVTKWLTVESIGSRGGLGARPLPSTENVTTNGCSAKGIKPCPKRRENQLEEESKRSCHDRCFWEAYYTVDR